MIPANNGNGKGLTRAIIAAIVAAVISSVVTAGFTMSSGNGKRDLDIVALQTTVQNIKEAVAANHDEDVKNRAELKDALEQVQINVARISQKLGVSTSQQSR